MTTAAIQDANPPKMMTTMDFLRQLDEIFSPGLPEAVFISLFLQCRVCHDIMTKRVFQYHSCLGAKPPSRTPVDLALDDLGSHME
jgi:hypothetical protein